MKKSFAIIFFLSALIVVSQENNNPMFQKSNQWGGFGGVSLTINPAGNIAVSGEGAWIFRNYYIGGFGGSSNYGSHVSPSTQRDYCLKRSMGGFMIGAISNSTKTIAIFGEARFGFGEILARTSLAPNVYEEYEQSTTTMTPVVGLAITPSNYAQVRLYAGYEYTTDFDLAGLNNEVTNGVVFGLGLYLGYFKD